MGTIPRIEEMRKADDERRKSLRERAEGYLAEGCKGFITLNGGSVLAMLGFMQALAGKPSLSPLVMFKPFGILAMAAFVVGAIVGCLAFLARWKFLRADANDDATEDRWHIVFLTTLSLPPVCLLIGAIIAGAGITRAL